MGSVGEIRRAWTSTAAVWAGLGIAGVFEVLTVLATQDKKAWAASPWREDPYHTVVSLAQFAVPMIGFAIAARLLAPRSPDDPDRAQQMVRAAGAITALIGLTFAFEWAAVIHRAHGWSWGAWNAVLLGGLASVSVLTVAVTVLLVQARRWRGSAGRWQHDWLGDVAFVCRRIPVLRRWARPEVVAWARRHAMTVFVVLSVLAAAAVTGVQAVGEHMTDPLLIAWFLIAETTSNVAFCVISNAVAGFIAWPPRTRARRITETSAVAGCVAIQVAIAFHDALWSAFWTGPLTPRALAALTLGSGLATSVVTIAVLLVRTARTTRTTAPERNDAASA